MLLKKRSKIQIQKQPQVRRNVEKVQMIMCKLTLVLLGNNILFQWGLLNPTSWPSKLNAQTFINAPHLLQTYSYIKQVSEIST